MPYTAYAGDRVVCPYQVSVDTTVRCPACDGEMIVRQEHYRNGELIPRVFAHKDASNCEGESDEHQKLKSVAAHSLEKWLPEANVVIEQQIPGTKRIADVVATLPVPVKPYGKGIIVEAQVSHKDKSIGAVSREYLEAEYSVYWSYLSDINTDSDLNLRIKDKRLWTVWPQAVPDHDSEDYYHDIHASRFETQDGYTTEDSKMEVVFPPEFLYAHGHDVADLLEDPTWHELETVWLSGNAKVKSWISVFHGEGYGFILDAWTKDASNGALSELSNLPIVSRGDIETLSEFAQAVQEIRNQAEIDPPPSQWQTAIEASLTGTKFVTATLEYGFQDGDPALRLTRIDSGENNFTLTVPWSDETLDGLLELPEAVARAVDQVNT